MNDISNDAALIDGLRGLIADCGPSSNKHDLATVLISACIDHGRDTRPQIVGALRALEFKPQHVAIILEKASGGNPERHLWQRDGQGKYTYSTRTAHKPHAAVCNCISNLGLFGVPGFTLVLIFFAFDAGQY